MYGLTVGVLFWRFVPLKSPWHAMRHSFAVSYARAETQLFATSVGIFIDLDEIYNNLFVTCNYSCYIFSQLCQLLLSQVHSFAARLVLWSTQYQHGDRMAFESGPLWDGGEHLRMPVVSFLAGRYSLFCPTILELPSNNDKNLEASGGLWIGGSHPPWGVPFATWSNLWFLISK